MLLSIVFSFRNEEENIPELARRVDAALRSLPDVEHEMIFVDDASTDGSLALLQELRARHPITIVRMSRQFGNTPCVLAGMAQARGDAVVYMDADLQDPPELIPELVEKYRAGVEVVHTVRTHRDGEGWLKLRLTSLGYRIIRLFSDLDLHDNAGDFKLLSRRALRTLLSLQEQDPYMRGLSAWIGFRQAFVSYRRQPRHAGRSHFTLFSKAHARELVRGVTTFSAAPLYLSLYLGLATCLVSLVLMFYAIATKLSGSATPGAPGILIAVAFFNGVILLTNGVIGLYVARIYNEVKGRPRYIVSEIIPAEPSAAGAAQAPPPTPPGS